MKAYADTVAERVKALLYKHERKDLNVYVQDYQGLSRTYYPVNIIIHETAENAPCGACRNSVYVIPEEKRVTATALRGIRKWGTFISHVKEDLAEMFHDSMHYNDEGLFKSAWKAIGSIKNVVGKRYRYFKDIERILTERNIALEDVHEYLASGLRGYGYADDPRELYDLEWKEADDVLEDVRKDLVELGIIGSEA